MKNDEKFMFDTYNLKPYKLTWWVRLKYKLFGKVIISVDYAKDGGECKVTGYYYKGKLYIKDIKDEQ